jgi:hypothetical protein
MDYKPHNENSQSLVLTIDASKEAKTDSVKLSLQCKMECSIGFMANCFKNAMQQDEHIKKAITIAIMDEFIGDDLETLLDKLAKEN